MANSASDARNSEADIRRSLIKSGVIDCMLTLPKNMFYTVTLPATLWFFDKSKEGKDRKVLFIDARNIFRQIDRAHREFTEEQIQNIATIVRLYRGENYRLKELLGKYRKQADEHAKLAAGKLKEVDKLKKAKPSNEKEIKKWEKSVECAEKEYKEVHDRSAYFESQITWLYERFPKGKYEDVTGLCKAATLEEIAEQDYSLNPGRYVGVVIEEDGLSEEEFTTMIKESHSFLIELQKKANALENQIDKNIKALI